MCGASSQPGFGQNKDPVHTPSLRDIAADYLRSPLGRAEQYRQFTKVAPELIREMEINLLAWVGEQLRPGLRELGRERHIFAMSLTPECEQVSRIALMLLEKDHPQVGDLLCRCMRSLVDAIGHCIPEAGSDAAMVLVGTQESICIQHFERLQASLQRAKAIIVQCPRDSVYQRTAARLKDMEKHTLQAAAEHTSESKCLPTPKIAEKSGYEPDSNYKNALSGLVKMGLLENEGRGYFMPKEVRGILRYIKE